MKNKFSSIKICAKEYARVVRNLGAFKRSLTKDDRVVFQGQEYHIAPDVEYTPWMLAEEQMCGEDEVFLYPDGQVDYRSIKKVKIFDIDSFVHGVNWE